MSAIVGVQKSFVNTGPCHLGMGEVDDPQKDTTSPHVTVLKLIAASQNAQAWVGNPQNMEMLWSHPRDKGLADHVETCITPHSLTG